MAKQQLSKQQSLTIILFFDHFFYQHKAYERSASSRHLHVCLCHSSIQSKRLAAICKKQTVAGGKKCLFREAIFYQMAWKKETFSSCPQMFCLVSHHTLFHRKKNHVYTTDIEGIDWADQLRSFYFQLRVIPHKNGTGISFDFHLIFQFVIVLFLTRSITQIKETKKGTDDQLLDSSGITTDQWFYPKQEESKITGDSKSTCGSQKTHFSSFSG